MVWKLDSANFFYFLDVWLNNVPWCFCSKLEFITEISSSRTFLKLFFGVKVDAKRGNGSSGDSIFLWKFAFVERPARLWMQIQEFWKFIYFLKRNCVVALNILQIFIWQRKPYISRWSELVIWGFTVTVVGHSFIIIYVVHMSGKICLSRIFLHCPDWLRVDIAFVWVYDWLLNI